MPPVPLPASLARGLSLPPLRRGEGLGVQRVLGLGSYQTAWTWLHKLRRAMVRPGRDRLGGKVEVDETYLGAQEEGVIGRRTFEKSLIVVAAQADGPKIGRIRMARVPDLTKSSLHSFITGSVEPGSIIVTDGLSAYGGLEGYRHEPIVIGKKSQTASELLPRVHLVVSLLVTLQPYAMMQAERICNYSRN